MIFFRDRYIEQLLYQIEQLTEELQRVKSDYRRYLEEYLERIHELESVVSDHDRELNREREAKVDMIRQLEDGTKIAEAETIQRIQNAEGRILMIDQRFYAYFLLCDAMCNPVMIYFPLINTTYEKELS